MRNGQHKHDTLFQAIRETCAKLLGHFSVIHHTDLLALFKSKVASIGKKNDDVKIAAPFQEVVPYLYFSLENEHYERETLEYVRFVSCSTIVFFQVCLTRAAKS